MNNGLIVYIREDVCHEILISTYGSLEFVNIGVKLKRGGSIEVPPQYKSEVIVNVHIFFTAKKEI